MNDRARRHFLGQNKQDVIAVKTTGNGANFLILQRMPRPKFTLEFRSKRRGHRGIANQLPWSLDLS